MAYIYARNTAPHLNGIGKRRLTNEAGAAEITGWSRSAIQKDRLKKHPVIPHLRLPNGRIKYDVDELNKLVETWHVATNATTSP